MTLAERMDVGWRQLVAAPSTAAALARWGGREPALDGWSDLDALREAVHDRGDLERGDRILAALVRLAAVTGHGDPLAARVVLQLLVPGAIRLANSLTAMIGNVADAEAAVFAELAILIRTYPWQRRPHRVAANLLLDCRQRLTRAHRRHHKEVRVGLVPTDSEQGDIHHSSAAEADRTEGEVAAQHLLWWARRRGVLSGFEAELLVASYVADRPMEQLVTRFGRSRSTLFAIRASAEQRLRQAITSQTDGTSAVRGSS